MGKKKNYYKNLHALDLKSQNLRYFCILLENRESQDYEADESDFSIQGSREQRRRIENSSSNNDDLSDYEQEDNQPSEENEEAEEEISEEEDEERSKTGDNINYQGVDKERDEDIQPPEYSDTSFPTGVYDSLKDLAEAINSVPELHRHLHIAPAKKKRGYYNLRKICECEEAHYYSFSEKVKRIFGFENEKSRLEDFITLKPQSPESRYTTITGNRPACLARAISDQFFVYSDICIPYTVGDIQASLLRIVVLDNSKYKPGVTMVKQFAPPNYIPLLNNTFQNVTIDIRDQHGNHIPFKYGTLTVTLHFKRCQ
ncbi:uncharacterized protein LOC116416708 [Nasonia vitripennis]|uniref:Uncharacterized protein n=1 Tax=Nasonia vitripennis TaxID=7425 RepID=A0A7M7R1G3_NASVI|nr:uncharacterized protein LOC116416708 [Nasonia vitripennis]